MMKMGKDGEALIQFHPQSGFRDRPAAPETPPRAVSTAFRPQTAFPPPHRASRPFTAL